MATQFKVYQSLKGLEPRAVTVLRDWKVRVLRTFSALFGELWCVIVFHGGATKFKPLHQNRPRRTKRVDVHDSSNPLRVTLTMFEPKNHDSAFEPISDWIVQIWTFKLRALWSTSMGNVKYTEILNLRTVINVTIVSCVAKPLVRYSSKSCYRRSRLADFRLSIEGSSNTNRPGRYASGTH
jgi:hypothetical protein